MTSGLWHNVSNEIPSMVQPEPVSIFLRITGDDDNNRGRVFSALNPVRKCDVNSVGKELYSIGSTS